MPTRPDQEAGTQDASDTALVAPCPAASSISYSMRSSCRLPLPALADSRPASAAARQRHHTRPQHRASARASEMCQPGVRIERASEGRARRPVLVVDMIPPGSRHRAMHAHRVMLPTLRTHTLCVQQARGRHATQHAARGTAQPTATASHRKGSMIRTTRMPNVSFDTSKTPSWILA